MVGMNISSRARWVLLALACVTGPQAAISQTTTPQPAAPPVAPSTAPQQPATAPATTPQSASPAQPNSTSPTSPTGSTAAPQSATPTLQPRTDQDAQDGTTFTLHRGVNEVDLIFTVMGKDGHFVANLQQQNFGLLDDGRPPQHVLRFTQQTNLPLRVGIMLDTSSSIRQRFEFEQQAATDFLLQVLHPADRAFVEGFDVQINIAQDFTNRIDMLDTGIRRLRPGGGTALFDSLYRTCKDQMLTLQQDAEVRKAIVLVSDGDDDYSRVLETEAIKMCQRAETIVYTISTNVGPSRDKGDDVLQQISDATGGQTFYPQRIDDVAIGFRNIEEELRSQYLLVYEPADFKRDGSFRTIYLHSLDPRYGVRAKKGYFSPHE
jgi:VWFA-related protein